MDAVIREIELLKRRLAPLTIEMFAALSLPEKRAKMETEALLGQLEQQGWLADLYRSADPLTQVVLASLIWIGQSHLLCDPHQVAGGWRKWHQLIDQLRQLELFYAPLGGVVGYHYHLLERLAAQLGKLLSRSHERVNYRQPPRIDIRRETDQVKEAIRSAAYNWSKICLLMPVGGAGDRLNLQNSSGHPLPAAFLPFEGRSLLEGLIADMEAIELLVEQITGSRPWTPIALMTSDEKNNQQLIESFLREHDYLGRPPETIRLFSQRRVPMVTERGEWATEGPLELMLKPGGHGVIWRAAEVSGTFDWLQSIGCSHGLVRQVNNPMAATDTNLLALAGFGLKMGKAIGFLSCERQLSSCEGVNVWRVREKGEQAFSCLTNVEYTDFEQEGIEDKPQEPGSLYSAFSSNTNIFIVSLEAVRQTIRQHSFPGLILNLKSKVGASHNANELVRVGRLESMMQNIADATESSSADPDQLDQFLLFGERYKIISVAKKHPPTRGFVSETPPSAFFERQVMWRQLLCTRCQFQLPPLGAPEEYFEGIPPFVVRLSPSLGPLHGWIGHRLQGGVLGLGSYLELDLCHLLAQGLELDGALRIKAKQPSQARVWLHQVRVVNEGWGEQIPDQLWKGELPKQRLEIELEGRGALIADRVGFEGGSRIVVPDGYLVIARQSRGGFELEQRPLPCSWEPPAFENFREQSLLWLGCKPAVKAWAGGC